MDDRAPQEGDSDNVAKAGWFGVRTLYSWPTQECFEERVTLWEAISLSDAIGKAEAEAKEYAEAVEIHFIGLLQAYDTQESGPRPPTEVFSLLRGSTLTSDEYINRFFDTGNEFEGNFE